MKTILITGGAKRLGLALTNAFLGSGWRVICHSYSSALKKSDVDFHDVSRLENLYDFQFDLSDIKDKKSAEDFLNIATKKFDAIDVLINNASNFEYDRPGELNPRIFDKFINVNCKAPILLMDQLLSKIDGKEKIVINILDSRVLSLNIDYTSYSISKHALLAATEIYASAYDGKHKIYGVAPSMFLESGPKTIGRVSELSSKTLLNIPIQIEDVISAVKFCTEGILKTGSIIPIDGGQQIMQLKRDVAYLDERNHGE